MVDFLSAELSLDEDAGLHQASKVVAHGRLRQFKKLGAGLDDFAAGYFALVFGKPSDDRHARLVCEAF
ncbi:hypothetical protein D3C86_2104010 [compost metagenome]